MKVIAGIVTPFALGEYWTISISCIVSRFWLSVIHSLPLELMLGYYCVNIFHCEVYGVFFFSTEERESLWMVTSINPNKIIWSRKEKWMSMQIWNLWMVGHWHKHWVKVHMES